MAMMSEKQTLLSTVIVVSSTDARLLGLQQLQAVLAGDKDDVRRSLLQAEHGTRYHLLVAPTAGMASQSLDEAADDLHHSLRNPSADGWVSTYAHDGTTYVGVLFRSASHDPKELRDMSLHAHSQWLSWQLPQSRGWRSLALGAGLLLLVAVTIVLFAPSKDPWIQYPVGNSIGPKYNYLLTPSNITAWADKHYHPAKYYIRIDDQALVPIELLDEQEARYQQYLSERYPEKAEMRDSLAFMDPTYFEDPNNFMLPTDMEFHLGHCVRAIRRYWQAKETGRHACPWDIDYRHMHHCFTALEEFMLVPGPRKTGPGEVMGLSWRTKVCDWEMSQVD